MTGVQTPANRTGRIGIKEHPELSQQGLRSARESVAGGECLKSCRIEGIHSCQVDAFLVQQVATKLNNYTTTLPSSRRLSSDPRAGIPPNLSAFRLCSSAASVGSLAVFHSLSFPPAHFHSNDSYHVNQSDPLQSQPTDSHEFG